jgi:hypothetical protein
MATSGAPSGPARQNKLQTALVIAIFVIGVIAALAFVFFYFRDSALISAYKSASSCATPGDAMSGEGCRYEGKAQVLSVSGTDRLDAVVAFDSLRGRTFGVMWPKGDQPDIATLQVGGTVVGELWTGKVTRLAGKNTVDEPEGYPTTTLLETAALIGGMSLIGFFVWVLAPRFAWWRKLSVPIGTVAPVGDLRWRSKVFAVFFVVVGVPLTAYLVVHARSGLELAYRVVTGVVLLVIVAYLAWRGWRPK